jgi:hypothetical protein
MLLLFLQVSYPISYYGHVSVEEVDGRQIFKWNAGETVRTEKGAGQHRNRLIRMAAS